MIKCIDTTDESIGIVIVDSGHLTVYLSPKALPAFKSLVQRAMNTWPDAPAELKEFADLLLEGKILQDYKSQG